ncbi:hypothetical protein GW17_00059252 [Ensete ventricosum]|nr:hypothetical protein GW17_00059252 [Ensete ventricosum]
MSGVDCCDRCRSQCLWTNVTQFMLLPAKDLHRPPMKRLRAVVVDGWEQKAAASDQGCAPEGKLMGVEGEDRGCGRRGLRLWVTVASRVKQETEKGFTGKRSDSGAADLRGGRCFSLHREKRTSDATA